MVDKLEKQRELTRRERQRRSVETCGAHCAVQYERTDSQSCETGRSPNERADPGHDLFHLEGLRDEGIDPALEGSYPVLDGTPFGQHEDRIDNAPLSKKAANRQAIKIWKRAIEHDEVERGGERLS